MSVNIDMRGEGVRPTLKTSRMSVYLSDTGISLSIYIYIERERDTYIYIYIYIYSPYLLLDTVWNPAASLPRIRPESAAFILLLSTSIKSIRVICIMRVLLLIRVISLRL